MLAFSGILLGMTSSILMQTILATVLPVVVRELGSAALYGWVFSAYMVAATVTIPIFAKLADLYGRKRFYLGGLVLFLGGTVLCGIAQTMAQLVGFRVVQGLGAGMLAPAAIAIISDLFPVAQRGQKLGILAGVQVLANVAGPLIGGLAADYRGWRWAFFTIIPVGLAALVMVAYGLRESRKTPVQSRPPLDLTGGILLGLGTVMLIQGLDALSRGASTLPAASGLVLAVVIWGLLLRQEKIHPDPVAPPELLRTRNVGVALASTLMLGAVMYGAIAILPLAAGAVTGSSALQGSRLLLAMTLGLGVGGVSSGHLSRSISYAVLASGGWAVAAGGFLLMALLPKQPVLLLAAPALLAGLGLGAILPIFLLPAQNAVAENRRAVVGGLLQIARNLGGALAIPVFTGQAFSRLAGHTASKLPVTVYLLLALVAVAGALLGRRFQGSVETDRQLDLRA